MILSASQEHPCCSEFLGGEASPEGGERKSIEKKKRVKLGSFFNGRSGINQHHKKWLLVSQMMVTQLAR